MAWWISNRIHLEKKTRFALDFINVIQVLTWSELEKFLYKQVMLRLRSISKTLYKNLRFKLHHYASIYGLIICPFYKTCWRLTCFWNNVWQKCIVLSW